MIPGDGDFFFFSFFFLSLVHEYLFWSSLRPSKTSDNVATHSQILK